MFDRLVENLWDKMRFQYGNDDRYVFSKMVYKLNDLPCFVVVIIDRGLYGRANVHVYKVQGFDQVSLVIQNDGDPNGYMATVYAILVDDRQVEDMIQALEWMGV